MTTTFYKKEEKKYLLKTKKTFPIIGLCFFICLEVYFLFIAKETKDSTILKIVPLIPILISIIEIGKKTIIDVGNKTIETSVFNSINKKQFHFKDLQQFVITQYTAYFIKNGVSLSVKYTNQGRTEIMQLARLNKASNIEKLLEETKKIIS